MKKTLTLFMAAAMIVSMPTFQASAKGTGVPKNAKECVARGGTNTGKGCSICGDGCVSGAPQSPQECTKRGGTNTGKGCSGYN